MKTKRGRIVPEGTSRAILLENVDSEIVLLPSKEGKKELVFYRVSEKELSESVFDYLLDEDIAKQKRLLNNANADVATECKHFDPVIPNKKKFYSCDYCRSSRDCQRFIKGRKKEYKN